MISGEKLHTIKSTIGMINRGLRVIGVEAIIGIDTYENTVKVYHSYANNKCIDIEKPSYTFPVSMLIQESSFKKGE